MKMPKAYNPWRIYYTKWQKFRYGLKQFGCKCTIALANIFKDLRRIHICPCIKKWESRFAIIAVYVKSCWNSWKVHKNRQSYKEWIQDERSR